MGARAIAVCIVWTLYGVVLACYGRFAWATGETVAAIGAVLAAFVGIYLLDVMRHHPTE